MYFIIQGGECNMVVPQNQINKLISESKDPMTKLKFESAKEIGHVQFCKEFNDEYKGNLTSAQNGHEGGPIGGRMVKKVFEATRNQFK